MRELILGYQNRRSYIQFINGGNEGGSGILASDSSMSNNDGFLNEVNSELIRCGSRASVHSANDMSMSESDDKKLGQNAKKKHGMPSGYSNIFQEMVNRKNKIGGGLAQKASQLQQKGKNSQV